MNFVSSKRPMGGLLVQSGLGRLADHMAGIIYGWGILQETGSSAWAGTVIGSHVAVLVLGTFFAGRLIARFGARNVALSGAWATSLSSLIVASLFLAGNADPLIVTLVGAMGAILEGPASIASETNYPEVARIARFDLLKLNALDDTLDHLAALAGPAAGAVIVIALGPAGATAAVAGISLLAALALTWSLPAFRRVAAACSIGPREVMAFLRGDRVLLPLTALFSVVIAFFAAIQLVILPRAVHDAGLDPSAVAWFLAAGAIGSLTGATVTATSGRGFPVREVVAAAFAMLGLGASTMALGPEPPLLALAGFVCGLPAGIVAPIAATLFQSRPPRVLRADVQSIAGALVLGSTPVALVLFGGLMEIASARTLLAAIAVGLMILAAIALAWLPASTAAETAQPAG